jgi:signal transduction histidine kinase
MLSNLKQLHEGNGLKFILYGGFFAVLVLMAISIGITLKSAANVKKHSDEALKNQLPEMLDLMEVEQLLILSQSHLNAYLISGEADHKQAFTTVLNKLDKTLYAHPFSSRIQSDLNVELLKYLEAYKQKSRQVIEIKTDSLKNYLGISRASELLNPLHQEFISQLNYLISQGYESDLNEQQVQVQQQLFSTHNSWMNMIMSLRVYFTTRSNKDYERIYLYREQSLIDIDKLNQLKDALEFESLFVEELINIHQRYMLNMEKVLSIYKTDAWRQDTLQLKTQVYPVFNNLRAILKSLVADKQGLTSSSTQVLTREMENLSFISMSAFTAAFLAGITIIFIVSANISRIVEKLKQSEEEANDRYELLRVTTDELVRSMGELKNTQGKLVEKEKMASLGDLVAGMTHEINTPIGISVTASSFITDRVKDIEKKFQDGTLAEDDFKNFLRDTSESNNMMFSNLKRAAELIGSFKKVAVDQTSEMIREYELEAYINEVCNSLQPKLKRTHITINIDCQSPITMYSYPGAMAQIITNLVLNSVFHGFEQEESGSIIFKLSLLTDDRVKILYQDNGRGMAEEDLKKIFEPFFTTKLGKGGSGLGMHLLYNLITQQLGGEVSVESQPGKGIKFEILLPRVLDVKQQNIDK